ncbi:MAG: asparagine synthase (glutamine-hydrolyzing), partial [Acidimicrobiales bacterium]
MLDLGHAAPPEELAAVASRMSEMLRHRGPDDGGVWVDEAGGVAIANRRLAVLDLSPAGHQPMRSRSDRYVAVFNGEIYNHAALRAEVEALGPPLRGHSDTETLLAAIDEWGLEATLARCNGMFALGVWDRQARCLQLARDRLGEKPLYYGWAGSSVVFGSELKPLRAHPRFEPRIDRSSLALYLRYTFVPSPRSIFERVWKLPPGTVLTI